MRQIVLDTETTGLDYSRGHKIIEIGCVEIIDRKITNNNFHTYVNPCRKIDEGAISVHGITNDFLIDKPLFEDIKDEFYSYINEAELIIHNAPFDTGFINSEFSAFDPKFDIERYCKIFDSLTFARKLFPGQKNSLDALCKRFNVDNSSRDYHGALLDANLLADVYLLMTGGQTSLSFVNSQNKKEESLIKKNNSNNGNFLVQYAEEEEIREHIDFCENINNESKSGCSWLQNNNEVGGE